MVFFNKIKWILGILMIFVLVVATNLIDRSNFFRLKDSVTAIYEDRLVANDLIFDISKSIQKKKMAVALSDTLYFSEKNNTVSEDIQGLILRFEETNLTSDERIIFETFKENLEVLNQFEIRFIASGFSQKDELLHHLSDLSTNLYDLSKIQLEEGGRQMALSKKAIHTVDLFTQIEIYILIFLGVLVQIIIIYKPKEDKQPD